MQSAFHIFKAPCSSVKFGEVCKTTSPWSDSDNKLFQQRAAMHRFHGYDIPAEGSSVQIVHGLMGNFTDIYRPKQRA